MSCKSQTMEPLRSLDDIRRVKEMLRKYYPPRDLALFTFGINTALRASDICKLTRNEVRHLKPGDYLTIKMKKTEKHIEIVLNEEVCKVLQPLLKNPLDGPLFPNLTDDRLHIGEKHLCRLVKGWCADARIKGRFGSHTLRKTWGYIQRTVFNTDWPTIARALGHTDLMVTMRYLGVQPDEVRKAFMNGI